MENVGLFGPGLFMPQKLKRYYGLGHLHFITFNCYHRMALTSCGLDRNLE